MIDIFNLRLRNQSMAIIDERMSLFEDAIRAGDPQIIAGVLGYVSTVNKGQGEQLRCILKGEVAGA